MRPATKTTLQILSGMFLSTGLLLMIMVIFGLNSGGEARSGIMKLFGASLFRAFAGWTLLRALTR